MKIDGEMIVDHDVEWGVEYVNSDTKEKAVCIAGDESDARAAAPSIGGRIVCRSVFMTAWADAPE